MNISLSDGNIINILTGGIKMLVYHGSPNKFDKFSYDKIRTNGTMEGAGFYFTDNKEIAKGYGGNSGYLYTAKLNINKSLSNEKKTLTIKEVEDLIKALPEDADFLSNYGDVDYEGYNEVMERALDSEYKYADSDTEILGSIYNACGENQKVIELFYSELGYDSIIARPDWGRQTIYIALTNDIIQISNVSSAIE